MPPVRTRSAALVVVIALAGAGGCYQLFPPVKPVDFCVEQARLYCELQFRCCTAIERKDSIVGVLRSRATLRAAPSSEGECTDVMADVCRAAAAQQDESLAEERVEYDADEALDCLDDLSEAVADCDAGDFFDAQGTYLLQMLSDGQPGVLGDSCDGAIDGDVDEGDTCFASYECKTGACVVTPDENEVTAEGECVDGGGADQNPFEGAVKLEICDGLDDDND